MPICTTSRRVRVRLTGASIAAVAVLLLAGCADGGGVQLNGKIFDALGVSGEGSGKKAEPRLAERAPLVPPPRTDQLPQPGAPKTAADDRHMAWPDDPDKRRVAEANAKQQQINAKCRNQVGTMNRPDAERAELEAKCRESQGGLLAGAMGIFKKNMDGAALETSDEGDPGAAAATPSPVVTGSTAKPAAAKAR